MAVVNTCLRPISAFLLYKIWQERKAPVNNIPTAGAGGDIATFAPKKSFGSIFTGSGDSTRKGYQEIPQIAA